MQKLVTGGMLALLIAISPLTVMAQGAPLDDATRATVAMMAQRTAASVNANVAAPAPVAGVTVSPPEVDEPEPEPTDDDLTTLPELNLTDLVEYTSQGVTFLAPADWDVETDFGDDSPFFIMVPGTEIFVSLEADAGLDFPSWLGLALFRSQAELLISEMGEGAQVDESATIFTDQNLPIAKLAFSGTDNGDSIGGVLYVVAPNEVAYLLVGGGPADQWAYAAPGIELIAESLVFDADLITVEQAGDAPLPFVDEEAGVEVTAPAGWYVMSTGDRQFPVMVSEPEVRYVAAIGTGASFGGNFDLDVLGALLPDTDELSEEESQALISAILEMVDDAGSPFIVDDAASTVTARDGAVTVKLVGEADLDQGLTMPIILYLDLRTSGIGVVAIFGDTESALVVEDEIQTMLESVNGQ